MSKAIQKATRRIQQFQSALKYEGLDTALLKAARFISRQFLPARIRSLRLDSRPVSADILFINGCALSHCRRYRVLHSMEQLESLGMRTQEKWYEQLSLDDLKLYRGFVFYRTPVTPLIRDFIRKGKSQNKSFFFDIDDLVIDRRYTDQIEYLKTLPPDEKNLYDDGVRRMRETLDLCDAAIVSTPQLAVEIGKIKPEVLIHPNVASDELVAYSEQAHASAKTSPRNQVILGYFSGSITHNPDLMMIAPALARILGENPTVHLRIVGLVELPGALKPFESRVELLPLMDWKRLPSALARIDINLAPLEDTLFNRAKSENRWMEAAWVRVPTICSKVGRILDVINPAAPEALLTENTPESWYSMLSDLVGNPEKRRKLGELAYSRVKKDYHTLTTGLPLKTFIERKLAPHIGFLLPSLEPRGGILVALRHAHILRDRGFDITLLCETANKQNYQDPCGELAVLSLKRAKIQSTFDRLVGTLWSTTPWVEAYPRARRRSYLVQMYEVDFMVPPNPLRKPARATYQLPGFHYLTISRWCQDWLREGFGIQAAYIPNGIDLEVFRPMERDFDSQRWRILIEGDSLNHLKNVDESFRIAEKLPRDEFEIWYVSYDGKKKPWYRVDRQFNRITQAEMARLYQQCHLLLKTSTMESFSYPPLEMLATGGLVVARANEGNAEFLSHGKNCLLYGEDRWEEAVSDILRLKQDPVLRSRLLEEGRQTAQARDWNKIEERVTEIYSASLSELAHREIKRARS